MKTDDRGADRYVLDSFAVLAYLEDEVGGALVEAVLADCERSGVEAGLSIVNFGEVVYITEREQGIHAAEKVIASIDQLPIRVLEADRDRTFAAAHIKAHHAMSYADAFAVALARELDARLVTGDPELEKTDLVSVLWIG